MSNNGTVISIILPSAVSGNTFVVPDGVTTLAATLLSSYSNITKVEIPRSVTSISTGFFNKNITDVKINSGNTKYKVEDKFIYENGTTLIRYLGTEPSVTIKSGIQTIASYAFQYNTNITNVNLSDVTRVNSQAFTGCPNLKSMHLGKNITNFDNMSIYGAGVNSITVDPDNPMYMVKADSALYDKAGTTFISPINRSGYSTYTIPSDVKKIATYAFHGRSDLKSIILPEGLEEIGGSFQWCGGLTSIDIPSTVTTISTSCFSSCGANLTEIRVHKPKGSISGAPWGSIYSEDRVVVWDN